MQKVCVQCGRRFEWRRKWAQSWAHVQHCSKRCRQTRRTALDDTLEQLILKLIEQSHRVPSKDLFSICQQQVGVSDKERVKSAARRLAYEGKVQWFQRGRRVDPSACAGLFELRRV